MLIMITNTIKNIGFNRETGKVDIITGVIKKDSLFFVINREKEKLSAGLFNFPNLLIKNLFRSFLIKLKTYYKTKEDGINYVLTGYRLSVLEEYGVRVMVKGLMLVKAHDFKNCIYSYLVLLTTNKEEV